MVVPEFQCRPEPSNHSGLSVVETFAVTGRVVARAWPYIVAAYVVAVVIDVVGLLVLFAVGFSNVGIGSSVAAALIAALVASLALVLWGCIATAPYIGVAALTTDTVIHLRPLMWSAVIRQVLTRLPALIGCMVATFVMGTVAELVLFMPIFLLPLEFATVGMLVAFVPAVSIVMLLDLAPWALMNEDRSVFGSIGRAIVLAKKSFLRLLGLHLVWGLGLAPLYFLAVEAGGFFTAIALVMLIFVVVPLVVTFQGVVYADLVSRETGVPIETDFPQPVMSVSRASTELRQQWLGRETAFAAGSGATPSGTAIPPRPRPGMRFNAPPGWQQAPDPNLLVAGFTPDPAWPKAPEGWLFWTPAVQSQGTPSSGAATLLSIVVPPLGIAVGYVARNRARAEGRDSTIAETAINVGLAVLGLWIVVGVIAIWTMNSDETSNPYFSYETEYAETTTATTTAPPGYTYDAANPISEVIRTSDVGACLNKLSSGTRITYLERVECSSGDANFIVTARSELTSECYQDWVRASRTTDNDYTVVLCLDPY